MGKKYMKFIINSLQIAYALMIFFNGVGQFNMIIENLGFIIWVGIAVLSLILCIGYFYKTKQKYIIGFIIISLFEIIFCVFIWMLPLFVGIPFD